VAVADRTVDIDLNLNMNTTLDVVVDNKSVRDDLRRFTSRVVFRFMSKSKSTIQGAGLLLPCVAHVG
jgi:hypothetical protein